jgi:SAM-dependent methyltransferase
MNQKAYYDAEMWYQREKTVDWYQQMERSNDAIKIKLRDIISAGSTVTEVACGGGWLAEFIATLKPKAYRGFDFAETAANNASKRLKNTENFICFQGDALSHNAYSPDTNLILAHQFLHCLIGDDRTRWMAICRDTLARNSGSVLLSSMVGLPDSVRDSVDEKTRINRPGNRYYAEDQEIQSELRSVGFRIVEAIYPEPHVGIYRAVV